MKELLEMLKSARVKNGYSQEYLSVILKVSSSRISRWEKGKTAMTLDQVLMYASKVDIQPTKIFEFLARNGQTDPLPIAEIHLEVFTEEAFRRFSQLVCELGIEHITIKTKRLR